MMPLSHGYCLQHAHAVETTAAAAAAAVVVPLFPLVQLEPALSQVAMPTAMTHVRLMCSQRHHSPAAVHPR